MKGTVFINQKALYLYCFVGLWYHAVQTTDWCANMNIYNDKNMYR